MTYQQQTSEADPAEQAVPATGDRQDSAPAVSMSAGTDPVTGDPVVDHALITELVAQGEADRQEIANLKRALETSRQIGAAIGVIMASHKVTDVQAFDLLAKESQTTNRKLRDIAADVVLTGTLPTTN
jgi:AmiR/NasT family two-component response regulator